MVRFVLRFQGTEGNYSSAVSAIEKLHGVKVVDRTPRMLLVEATSSAASKLASLPEWGVSPENFTPLPDTRKRIGQRNK